MVKRVDPQITQIELLFLLRNLRNLRIKQIEHDLLRAYTLSHTTFPEARSFREGVTPELA